LRDRNQYPRRAPEGGTAPSTRGRGRGLAAGWAPVGEGVAVVAAGVAVELSDADAAPQPAAVAATTTAVHEPANFRCSVRAMPTTLPAKHQRDLRIHHDMPVRRSILLI